MSRENRGESGARCERHQTIVHHAQHPVDVLAAEREQPGAADISVITLDPATGRLALGGGTGTAAFAGRTGGVRIVDPETGAFEELPVRDAVVNLGFARNGELAAITASDGTVRLWDVVRNASAGIVWTGSGAVGGSPSWYDAVSETIWVHSSGKLLQIPLDPDRWLERACIAAGRNFTQDEWDRYVPGDELLWFSCVDQIEAI